MGEIPAEANEPYMTSPVALDFSRNRVVHSRTLGLMPPVNTPVWPDTLPNGQVWVVGAAAAATACASATGAADTCEESIAAVIKRRKLGMIMSNVTLI